jgi:hypothetical protein
MKTYEQRVRELEEQGLTRSDAQSVVDAEDMKVKHKYLNQWLQQKWTVGQYAPTETFKQIANHSCVCRPDLGLVAITGPADCEESQMQSDLFAAAPEMLEALEFAYSELNCRRGIDAILDALKHAIDKARGGK